MILPLILPSIPIAAVILGIIIEAKEMAAIALLFGSVMWPIPAFTVAFVKIHCRLKQKFRNNKLCFQALLLLGFVRKTAKSKVYQIQIISKSLFFAAHFFKLQQIFIKKVKLYYSFENIRFI